MQDPKAFTFENENHEFRDDDIIKEWGWFEKLQEIYDNNTELLAYQWGQAGYSYVTPTSVNIAMIDDAVTRLVNNDTQKIIYFYKEMIHKKLRCKISTADIIHDLNVSTSSGPEKSDHFTFLGLERSNLAPLMILLPNCPRLGQLYFRKMENAVYDFDPDSWNEQRLPIQHKMVKYYSTYVIKYIIIDVVGMK